MNGKSNFGFEDDTASFQFDNFQQKSNGLGDITENDPDKTSEDHDESEEKARPQWGRSIEFLMSCISMSVGLGNIWRFPFTAYENGGGAFLIPYIIVLLLCGKPMYYLEMILGQFTSRSAFKIWAVNPLFKGIGIGQIIGVFSVITYYCSMIALTLHYIYASCAKELPWTVCKPEWGDNCVNSKPEPNATHIPGAQSSAELYFLKQVLKEKDDISDGIGYPDWSLSLWLLLAWVVSYLIIIKGIRSSGKAAYFLAIFPYVVLITLLIRAVTLDGAVNGILFFIKPNFAELLNPKVWYAATTQLFFSLNVGMTTIVMFSSYNQFSHNIYRDALIVTSLDTCTSILAGTTIFAILGNLAHNLGVDNIDEVVKSGSGLAFISYPDAIAKIDVVPQFFAVLFFFMLFVLGVGSLVALVSGVVTILWDQFPRFKYWHLNTFVCIAGYCCGLLYVTPGGQWMLNLVDHYGGTFLIFVMAIIELMAIFWIYGLENFCNDITFMTNKRPGPYWRVCWLIVTPLLMIVIFIYSMATLKPLTYSNKLFPDSAYVAGWALFAIGVLQVPLWGSFVINWRKPIWENIKKATKPLESWGPVAKGNYRKWKEYKDSLANAKYNDELLLGKPNAFKRFVKKLK